MIALTRYRLIFAIASALVGFLALTYYRNAYYAEKARYDNLVASYTLAQAQAEAKALSEVRAQETAQRSITTRIEDERNALQNRFADLSTRYRERVRGKAPACSAGSVPAAGEDPSPQFPAATAEAPLVGISRDDFDRCTVIAADIIKAREWALSL